MDISPEPKPAQAPSSPPPASDESPQKPMEVDPVPAKVEPEPVPEEVEAPKEPEMPEEPEEPEEEAQKPGMDYDNYTPISALNTISSDWMLLARVSKKSNVRTF